MSMNNAALELALRAAMSRLTAAVANRDAPNSLKLEGFTLAEITATILAGTAANATLFDGKTYAEVITAATSGNAADIDALEAALATFIARTDNPHAVTKAQVGLGDVENFGVATQADADALAANKYVTPAIADYLVQKAVDALVGASPETLNTISEIAAALQNDPDIINTLMTEIGTKETPAGAQAKADLAESDAIAAAALDATTKADAAQAAAIASGEAYTDAAIAGVDASLERATQIEAEAGTDAVKLMTPLSTAQAIAAIGATLFLGVGAQAADSALLEGQTLAQVISAAQAGVDMSNVVQKTDDFGQYSVGGQLLSALLADLASGADLTTLQTSFNAFVAAKASSAEAVAGTDDVKYVTSLSAKAAIDAAIDALVGAAPAALDTINELAAALNNDPDIINNLTSLIGTKLTQAEVQAEIAAGLVPVDARLDTLEAAVGEGSDFLQSGVDDLGTNPVVVTSDQVTYSIESFNPGTANYSVVRNAGELTVQVDPELDGTFVTPAEALDAALLIDLSDVLDGASGVDGTTYFITRTVISKTLKQHVEAFEAADQALDDRITGEVAGLNSAITAVSDASTAATAALALRADALEADDVVVDGRLDTLEAGIATKLEQDGSLDAATVNQDVEGTPTQVLIGTVLAALEAHIQSVEDGGAGDLAALQTAFNDFVAAKATGAEVITGTDDVKYTTSLAVKAAITDAIDALVGAAPAALDTINEIAAALQNDPDVINNLMTSIGTKLGADETAVDSDKLGGVVAADYATKVYVDDTVEALTEGFIASALELAPNYNGDLTIADLGAGSYGFNATGSIAPATFGSITVEAFYWDASVATVKVAGDKTAVGIDAAVIDGLVLNALVSATFAAGSTTFVLTVDKVLPTTGVVEVAF